MKIKTKLLISYAGIALFIFIIFGVLYYMQEKTDVENELKSQFTQSLDNAVNYFDQVYSSRIRDDLEFISNKSPAELRKIDFTAQAQGIYLSARIINTRARENVSKDAYDSHLFILYERLKTAKLGSILFEGPFIWQHRSTFLAGISKIDPTSGGFAGAVVFHCDLSHYWDYLGKNIIYNEKVARAFSLNNEVLYSPKANFNSPNYYTPSKIIMVGSNFQPFFKVNLTVSPDIFYQKMNEIISYFIYCFLLGIIPVVIIAYFISKHLSEPLIVLAQHVDKLAKGDFSTRVKIKADGEVGILIESFNRMAGDIQKITVSLDDLREEIEERQQIEQELRLSRENLTKRALESKLLFEITKMVAQTDSSSQALQECLKDICQFTHWTLGHIYLFTDNGTRKLSSSKIWFIKEEDKDTFAEFKKETEKTHFSKGIGLPGKIWQTGEPFWIRNIKEDAYYLRFDKIKGTKIKGAFGLPIKIQNEIVAVAEFYTDEEMGPDEDLLVTARNVGEQMGRVFERERAEKGIAAAQAQLLQSEKLASIGQLAAGVAHEINNPVGFISNNMELLAQYVSEYTRILKMVNVLKEHIEKGDLEKARALIRDINQFEIEIQLEQVMNDTQNLLKHNQSGIERIQKIVMDLRTFARDDNDMMEMVKIEEVIDSILSIVQTELKYKAELVKKYDKTPLVKCNAQRMGQVFINLLVNATHAIVDRGTIEIRTYRQDKYLCIDFKDTGKGIPPENLKKIFDPFFSTKPVGQGTGLGLSVSYEIVKKHGGDIRVVSEVGKGSTFSVLLPLS